MNIMHHILNDSRFVMNPLLCALRDMVVLRNLHCHKYIVIVHVNDI